MHGVFTPPAASSSLKNFKLAVDDEGKVVPYTEREAEGEIPHPKRSPGNKKPQLQSQQLLTL